MPNFGNSLNQYIKRLNNELSVHIERLESPETLKKSMLYSLQAGGKRIRPLLIFATLDAFKKDMETGLPAAISVEMIHTYSLIHDDLPSMDDDDLRRGVPANHKVFGEAMAILAGDALLTYSFQVLSEVPDEVYSVQQKLRLVNELAKACGPEGMVAGQVADLEGEGKQLDLADLDYIHSHKTGKLLSYCIKAGAIIAEADDDKISTLERFAKHIGIAFQIRDDILDVEGSPDKTGKSMGSDLHKQKGTFPSILTMENAKEKLDEHLTKALQLLKSLDLETEKLEKLTKMIGARDH